MESFSFLCSKRRGASIVDIKNTGGASSIQNQVFIRIKIKWCVVFVVIHRHLPEISTKTLLIFRADYCTKDQVILDVVL